MSKGSRQRPPAVPPHTLEDNWSRTFPKQETKKPDPPEIEQIIKNMEQDQ